MLLYWLWLTQRSGFTARRIRELLTHFSSPEEVFYAQARDFARLGADEQTLQSLCDKKLDEAKRTLEQCQAMHIQIMACTDEAYPAKLRAISDPPAVLYLRGRLPQLEALPSVGVVGTRTATAYGLQTAMRLSYQLARCGAVVVTGLARGIDSEAARGALYAEGQVIGVLGCGVDVVYPAENRSLYADVTAYGCLLSEYPPGTKPLRWNFPVRNRIISALSDGVLIVEAGESSGSLITARLALEQGRDVFAVPGTLDNPADSGSNALLQQGAGLVTCGYDVLREYEGRYPGRIRAVNELPPKAKPVPPVQPPVKKPPSLEGVSPEGQAVLQALTPGRLQLDDLIAATGLPAGKVLSTLTLLQIRGAIAQLPGKWYQISL